VAGHLPEAAVTGDLVYLYRAMVEAGANFQGLSIIQHRALIGKLVKQHGAQTLLDFGCGRGDAWRPPHDLALSWRLQPNAVTLYDPAFAEHDELPPMAFDGVLCSDVLEHIPSHEVNGILAALIDHAKTFVWASVCCRPAKKHFPDGVNMHVTVMPLDWWQERVNDANRKRRIPFYLTETP
jgi:hypothetical protein